MRQGILFGVIAIFLAAFFIMTLSPPSLFLPDNEVWIPIEEVRGSAVIHQGKEYTLNFEQQKKVVQYLNNAEKVTPPIELDEKANPGFSELAIYRFGQTDLRLRPNINGGGQLLFSYIGENGKKEYVLDTSKGQLLDLLQKTYD